MNITTTIPPLYNCFRPVHFTNRFVGKEMIVPCGKCPACLSRKDSRYSALTEVELKKHKYGLFATLTYDNDHVPYYTKLRSFYDTKGVEYFELAFNRDGSIIEVPKSYFDHFDTSYFNLPADALFACQYRKDVQDFLKRLRINVNRFLRRHVSLRYIVCCEYGPKTFRPHYHIILFYDDDELNKLIILKNGNRKSLLSCLIAKSWPLADKSRTAEYCSLVSGGAGNYVSSYNCSVGNLPRFLQLAEIRPWSPAHSTGFGVSKVLNEEIQKNVLRGDYCLHRTDAKTKLPVDVPISSSDRNRLFARFPCFDRIPFAVQRFLLSVCRGESFPDAIVHLSLSKISLFDTCLIKSLFNTSVNNWFLPAHRPKLPFSLFDFISEFSCYKKIVNSPMLTDRVKNVFKCCRRFISRFRVTTDFYFDRLCDLDKYVKQSCLKSFYYLQNIYLSYGYKEISWHYPFDVRQENSDLVYMSRNFNFDVATCACTGYFGSSIFSEYKSAVNSLILNKLRVKSHNDLTKFNHLIKNYSHV